MTNSGVPPVIGNGHELMDVWSRWGSKYRLRAVALLTLNVLLFAGAACFTYWLRSGVFFAPAQKGYWNSIVETFSGVGQADVSLAAFLVEPISIHDVPMQIPIVGLLMAALISIPILVAILYRFWFSIPFILIIGFIAVMPWLAITLLVSCVIASVRPFRTRIRFMSAMLALIPAIVYLVLAYSGTRDIVVGRIDPVDRVKFVAPWVLAMVASAGVFAIVLSIARMVNYRPGAVTPLLALMFALPVLLFERHVGRDELYYRLLERLNREYFSDANAGMGLQSSASTAGLLPGPLSVRRRLKALEEESWVFELAVDLSGRQKFLAEDQADILKRCDWFRHHFPYSMYGPNVLYIRARAMDLRLDVPEFRRTRWIRLYDDFPTPQSRQSWEMIAENRPDSPLGAVAMLRISQLDARDCEMDRAVARLDRLVAVFGATTEVRSKRRETDLFVDRPPPEAGLDVSMGQVLLKAAWLGDLIKSNVGDDMYQSGPLCGVQRGRQGTAFGVLDLDAREEGYAEKLVIILKAFPDCLLSDNIELEEAKSRSEPQEQVAALRGVLERYPKGDAVPETLMRLALALRSAGESGSAAVALDRLVREHPHSIWARQCLELRLRPATMQVTELN